MKNIKAFWQILLSLCLIIGMSALTLTACGGSETKDSGISIYDLQKAVLGSTDKLPDMLTVNSNDSAAKSNFAYISDIDYGKVADYFLSYSSEGLADEIVVIKVKKSEDVKETVESLKDHAAGRVALYEQYDPTQTKRAEEATIFSVGNYICLIIAEESNAVEKAIHEAVD